MKRKRKSEDEFSLFPFLDALSGVIGILALIIAVMAIMGLNDSRLLKMKFTADNGKKPVFVECNAEGIIIHPDKTTVETKRLGDRTSAWISFVKNIAESKEEYIVFLIRPEGIKAYNAASQNVYRSMETSRELIDENTSLDFS